MHESLEGQPSRKRLITFWVLAVIFVVLAVAPRPFMFPWIATLWAGEAGDMRTHELHGIINSSILWLTLIAVAMLVRRTTSQVGALWALMIIGVLPLAPMLALGGVPADVVPIVGVILALGVVVFFAHPAPQRAKFSSAHGISPVLLAMAVVLAVPLVVFASGQYSLFIADLPGDEHREFGHWLAMGSYALSIGLMAFVTGARVPGFRVAGWFTAAPLGLYALASLVLPAVHGSGVASTWSTPWAVLALVWAAGFALAVEREARAPATAAGARVVAPAG